MIGDVKYRLAKATGIPAMMNRINRNRPVILAYHGMYDGHSKNEIYPDTFIHVDDYVKQLLFIKSKYNIISPDDLQSALEKKIDIAPHSALITFDDGYESFYRLAFPVLKSMNIKALVFIPTEYVEKQIPFWFDVAVFFLKTTNNEGRKWLDQLLGVQSLNLEKELFNSICLSKMKKLLSKDRDYIIEQMMYIMKDEFVQSVVCKNFYPMSEEDILKISTEEMMIGGHTHRHVILTNMPDDMAEKEITINKDKLERLINKPCLFFAYPNGCIGDFHDKHKTILKKAGYIGAFTIMQKRARPLKDPMAISRIHIAPEDTIQSIDFHCSGVALSRTLRNLIKFG